jgi:hypothetical protein
MAVTSKSTAKKVTKHLPPKKTVKGGIIINGRKLDS